MELTLKRNEAAEIIFPMVDSASPKSFKSGETVSDDAYSYDGTSWSSLAITATASEIGSSGVYSLSMTAGELNHPFVLLKLTSANAADQCILIRTYQQDIDDVVGMGPGASAKVYELVDKGGSPVADADVWLTSDAAGSNVVEGTYQTDSSGEVTFHVDVGSTYYAWAQKDGVNFDLPDEWTVS